MVNQSPLKTEKNPYAAGMDQTTKNFITVCCLSFFVHGLLFVGIFLLHGVNFSKPLPRVVQVDLVSFVPGPAGGQGEKKPKDSSPEPKEEAPMPAAEVVVESEPAKPPADPVPKEIAEPVKPTPEPVAELKPDISLKTKPKNLKEMVAEQEKKEKEIVPEKPAPKPKPKEDPEEALKKAREKKAKEVETQNQKQIADALARMQASIKARGSQRSDKIDTNQGQTAGPGGTGAGTGMGRQGYEPIDVYKMLLQSAIEQNWVFNDMLARIDQGLEVRVMIKILKNGEIRDIDYETRSGNHYLDESAKKAINRANPLPELPKGMNSYEVVVIFTPRGLK